MGDAGPLTWIESQRTAADALCQCEASREEWPAFAPGNVKLRVFRITMS